MARKSDNTALNSVSGHESRVKYINASGTYTVTTSAAVLQRIVVNTTAAGAILIRSGSRVLGSLKSSISEGTYTYNMFCKDGITLEVAAASDITVVFAK